MCPAETRTHNLLITSPILYQQCHNATYSTIAGSVCTDLRRCEQFYSECMLHWSTIKTMQKLSKLVKNNQQLLSYTDWHVCMSHAVCSCCGLSDTLINEYIHTYRSVSLSKTSSGFGFKPKLKTRVLAAYPSALCKFSLEQNCSDYTDSFKTEVSS